MADSEDVSSSYGHYRIVSKLGSGGMGVVYLAEDTKLDRRVALKILQADIAADQERIRRFVLEAKAASALNHPNIVTVFEIGEENGTYYLVTELIRGRTLRELMQSDALEVTNKVDIGIQAASALATAHEHGLIHRDVKPENLMVRDDGLVKVLDFGLAKLAKRREPMSSDMATLEHYVTGPGVLVGTTAYMSPEQARGLDIDGRSDAFSLGIVLYELFTGRHPFPGESHADIVSAILKDDPAPISERAPELPKELERIIDKLLRKDRETRYQQMKDLRLDLEDLRYELRYRSKGGHSKQSLADRAKDTHEHMSFGSAFTSNIAVRRRFTALHAMLFLAAAVVGFVGLWLLSSSLYPPAREPGSYPTTEIATWSSAAGELSTDARFSPNGKMIAYSSTRSGSPNIWVVQTASSDPLQITNDEFSNTDPIWSPKGDEIAFFSDRPNAHGIWRVSALGGAPRLVASTTKRDVHLRSWTPSGKIYFQLDGNLHAIDASTGNIKQVTSFEPDPHRWVSISVDGKTLAYFSQVNDAWTISTSNVDGSEPVQAASGNGDVDSLVWSGDKQRFYYGTRLAGVKQIFMTSVSSPASSVRITASETDAWVMDVSADGRSLIVGSAKEESDLWRVAVRDGKETPLVRDLDEKLWPAVSPNDRRVAYQSVRNMSKGDRLFEGAIVVKEVSDPARPRVAAENGYLPAWSPDGRHILFLRLSGKTVDLMMVDPDAGVEPRLVGSGIRPIGFSVSPYNPIHSRPAAWSPVGSTIAYISDKNGISNVWTISPDGNEDKVVTENTDASTSYHGPFWGPDGARLAFLYQTKPARPGQQSTRGVRVLDVAGRRTTDVYQTNTPLRLLGWTPDSGRLMIAEGTTETAGRAQETLIRSVPVHGGPTTEIVRLPNAYYFNIFVSDDNRTIAYAAREKGVDDIWTVPSSGGTPRRITNNSDPELYFSRLAWFSDGTSIVFGKQTRFSLLSLITDID